MPDNTFKHTWSFLARPWKEIGSKFNNRLLHVWNGFIPRTGGSVRLASNARYCLARIWAFYRDPLSNDGDGIGIWADSQHQCMVLFAGFSVLWCIIGGWYMAVADVEIHNSGEPVYIRIDLCSSVLGGQYSDSRDGPGEFAEARCTRSVVDVEHW